MLAADKGPANKPFDGDGACRKAASADNLFPGRHAGSTFPAKFGLG